MAHSESHDSATKRVSDEDRMSRGPLTMVWFSLCSAIFYLLLGATLATTFGTRNALIGTFLGVVALSGLGYIFSRFAIRSGESCYLLSRRIFGTLGASLATLIFAVIAIYYAVFESAVVAAAAVKVFSAINYVQACAIIAVYSIALAVGSIQKWLDKLNAVLLPIYVIGLIAVVAMSIHRFGYSREWLNIPAANPTPAGWWYCFIAVFGMQLLMMITLDIGRFGKTEAIEHHSKITFGFPFYVATFLVNMSVGIYLAASANMAVVSETAVIDVCLMVLGGPLGLLFIWVTQTRINTANFFLSSSNLQAFLRDALRVRVPRLICTLLVGAVVFAFTAASDVLKYILIAVNYQAVILTAWVGVALAYITSRAISSSEAATAVETRTFIPQGLVAWFAGAAVGLTMMASGGAVASFSSPVTLAITFGLYRLLGRTGSRAQLVSERT